MTLQITPEEIDRRYMAMALAEAQEAAAEDEVPIGAIVVCNGKIVGRGHNRTQALNDVTAHAEMQAITAAAETLGGKYLTECTMYVTVEPCAMCAGALAWAQLRRLVYAAPEPRIGHTRFSPSLLHPKTSVTSGVLAEECTQLMKDFFRAKR